MIFLHHLQYLHGKRYSYRALYRLKAYLYNVLYNIKLYQYRTMYRLKAYMYNVCTLYREKSLFDNTMALFDDHRALCCRAFGPPPFSIVNHAGPTNPPRESYFGVRMFYTVEATHSPSLPLLLLMDLRKDDHCWYICCRYNV